MAPTIVTTPFVPPAGLFDGGGPRDLVSLAAVKAFLDITAPDSDDYLQLVISQISDAVQVYCGRTFPAATWLERIYPERDAFPWQVPGGLFPLQLSQWPIAATPSQAGTAAPAPPRLGMVAGGALPARSRFVRASYMTATDETAASLETTLRVPAGQLLTVAAPGPDRLGLATGWNVYVGDASGNETLQASSLPLGSAWTEPAEGIDDDETAPPAYVLVVENIAAPSAPGVNAAAGHPAAGLPVVLIEGVDFLADAEKGQLIRLFSDGYPKRWNAVPIAVVYPAGYEMVPPAVQLAVLRLAKGEYFARTRDPKVREENVPGVYQASYWFANGPGDGNFPPDICMLLDMFRAPVVA